MASNTEPVPASNNNEHPAIPATDNGSSATDNGSSATEAKQEVTTDLRPLKPILATHTTFDKYGAHPLLGSFKQISAQERMRMNEKQRVARETKPVRLNDLKKFSQNFKLNTPVPADLVPILAKDETKQREIILKSLRASQEKKPSSAQSTVSIENTKTGFGMALSKPASTHASLMASNMESEHPAIPIANNGPSATEVEQEVTTKPETLKQLLFRHAKLDSYVNGYPVAGLVFLIMDNVEDEEGKPEIDLQEHNTVTNNEISDIKASLSKAHEDNSILKAIIKQLLNEMDTVRENYYDHGDGKGAIEEIAHRSEMLDAIFKAWGIVDTEYRKRRNSSDWLYEEDTDEDFFDDEAK